MRLIIPIAAAIGGDPTDIPVSRSSIRRKRISNRRELAASIKAAFAPNVSLVLHFDEKILPEISGAGQVNRLPVLVTGDGIEKLLGVPKLPSGTGAQKQQQYI